METIKRHVRELSNDECRLYEQTIGHALRENQQIIIQIITVDAGSEPPENEVGSPSTASLPSWCNVYDGLSDEEIEDVERIALERSDLTRPSD